MNVLIILAHPETASFNHALAQAAFRELREAGHRVELRDLHAECFAAVASRRDFKTSAGEHCFDYQAEQRHAVATGTVSEDLAEHMRLVEWCDLIIFQTPIWWFSVPAILKGWFDRVLMSGWAYGGGSWFETAPLYGRRALLSLTSGAGPDRWCEQGLFGDIERILYALRVGTLNFCGFEVLPHHIVAGPRRMNDAERQEVMDGWLRRLKAIDRETPLPFRRAGDHDNPSYRPEPTT